jgi:hypothetical protein
VTRALWAVVVVLAATVTVPAQEPCVTGPGARITGHWAANAPDDTAVADPTIPKAEFPAILRRADALIGIIRNAAPDVTGLEARAYRVIRGDSYVAKGPERYGATALFLTRYCSAGSNKTGGRGTVRAEDETGTWVYINVNDLGWLWQERLPTNFRTTNGATIYEVPATGPSFKGQTLYRPNVHPGQRTEAIILTLDGQSPYRPLTRERFLQSRERLIDQMSAEQQKTLVSQARFRDEGIAGVNARAWPEDRKARERQTYIKAYEQVAADTARGLARLQADRAAIERVIAAMSPEDRQAPAIVRDPNAAPDGGKLFVTEAEGGRRLATLDRRNFVDDRPRAAARLIVVYWRWEDTVPAAVAMIQEFKQNLDVEALKALLGR